MKNKTLPVILTSQFITVVTNQGKSLSLARSDARFDEAVALLRDKDFDGLVAIMDRPKLIEKYSQGTIKVFDGVITHNGKPLVNCVTRRILEFISQGLPFEPLVAFLNNLYQNTDEDVRQRLFTFLEHNNLPITERGSFLVYKLVSNDGTPPYHKTTFNRLLPNGTTITVSRYEVGGVYTMPRENTIKGGECSSGRLLYAGNRHYWNSNAFNAQNEYVGEGKMLIGEVYPQDVCNVSAVEASKVAVCKLTIIDEYQRHANIQDEMLFDTATKKIVKKKVVPKPVFKKFGTKPNGDKFWNVRDEKGHFVSKK